MSMDEARRGVSEREDADAKRDDRAESGRTVVNGHHVQCVKVFEFSIEPFLGVYVARVRLYLKGQIIERVF